MIVDFYEAQVHLSDTTHVMPCSLKNSWCIGYGMSLLVGDIRPAQSSHKRRVHLALTISYQNSGGKSFRQPQRQPHAALSWHRSAGSACSVVLELDFSLGQTTRALGEALGSASLEVTSGSVYHAVGSIAREKEGIRKKVWHQWWMTWGLSLWQGLLVE